MRIYPCKVRMVAPVALAGLIAVIALAGCQGQTISPATATAQSIRAESLATAMAQHWQATQNAEYVHAAATAQAIQDLTAKVEAEPAIIDERFDDNSLGWPDGDTDDPLATLKRSITGGVYQWEAEAKDGFVWWTYPEMESVGDFYLAVDAQQISGTDTGETGLAFRLSDDDDYYLFEISAQKQYAVFLYQAGEWSALIDWTESAALSTERPNRLAVLARGDTFTLLINDTLATTFTDATLPEGRTAILIGLSTAGDRGVWQFDNFTLHSLQK